MEEREGLTQEEIMRGSYYLTHATLNSLGEIFEGAKSIMAWLNKCALVISKTNLPVTWVTPLGYANTISCYGCLYYLVDLLYYNRIDAQAKDLYRHLFKLLY